jgi:glutamyl-Q tRNA(Asp) synthetase
MTLAFGARIVTRFAPSPTGFLHLGHAHSALLGHRTARRENGRFLLRIEDIDRTRCKPEFERAIFDDLHWLGLDWQEPVRRQSDHFPDYAAALARLEAEGLLYPCFCSRKDIAAAASAPHGAPSAAAPSPDGEALIYPGTCRGLDPNLATERKAAGAPFALRLDTAAAARRAGPLTFWEAGPDGAQWREIRAEPERFGDVVLGRRDTPASYHLCATLDDHLQGVTLVIRGEDLRAATHLHRLLQAVFGLASPRYWHHVLLTNELGVRLSKRDGALALRTLRERGLSAAAVRKMAGFQDA